MGRFDTSRYAKLVERGCLCGSEDPAGCPLHEPRDNRGLRAFYEAGMPLGFPMDAWCAICGSEGLMYPNINIDDPGRNADPQHDSFGPTLACPRCSVPAVERALVADASQFGYELNDKRVFALAVEAA